MHSKTRRLPRGSRTTPIFLCTSSSHVAMYRPRELAVKEFLKDTSAAPTYKKPKANVCEPLKYFCRTTANHGFAHLVDKEELFCLKIAWTILIAIFTYAVITLSVKSIEELLSGSFTTEIYEDVALSGDDYEDGSNGAILPDIHICDSAIFSAKRLRKMGFNSTMATYLALATSDHASDKYLQDNNETLAKYKEEFDRTLGQKSLTISSILKNTTLSCMDMIWACSHGGELISAIECCQDYFNTNTYVSIFGSCISTHGKPLKQSYESRDAGFVVFARPNLLDSLDFDERLIKLEYTLQRGMYYAVSSSAVDIQETLHTSGRFALPRTWVSLPIHRTVIINSEMEENVLAPWMCVNAEDMTYKEEKTPEYDYYSERNCYNAYWQQIYRQYANCSAVFYNYGNSTDLCDPHTIITFDRIFYGDNYETYECPRECVKKLFKVSPSYAEFNSEYLNRLTRRLNFTMYAFFELLTLILMTVLYLTRADPIALHFFYPSFTYRVHISHVKSFMEFLGEFGGHLGFFLGASLLSIAEVLALILRWFAKSYR